MSSWAQLEKALEDRARFDTAVEQDLPTPFSEATRAAFSLTRREELFSSGSWAWIDMVESRADTIAKLGGDRTAAAQYAQIPAPVVQEWRDYDSRGQLEQAPSWSGFPWLHDSYRHVRTFEQKYPGNVMTDQALREQFKAESAVKRAGELETMRRGSFGATLVGTAGAVMTDPLILASLPFGGGEAAVGRTTLGTIGRVAAIEGGIATAVEVPIQAQVYRFKRELDAPWTVRDSALNVLAAGLGGAALGGTIAGGVEGTRKALAAYRQSRIRTPEMDRAAEVLENTLHVEEGNPLAVDGTPAEGPHHAALDAARAQDEAGVPIDVTDQVQGFEPEDGVGDVLRRADSADDLEAIDPRTTEVDAELFQFKGGTDAEGVNQTLKGVKRFDRRLAGVSLIWERADGKRFIADGHQRRALGVRALEAGQDPAEVRLNGFILREADGVTALDARRMAAVKNMAEGTGSALDAAKILREVGSLGETALPPLPPSSALVRQARGLAQLTDDNFMQIVNGVIDERFGALVGSATDDGRLQQAMIRVLKQTSPANEVQARSIVDQVRSQGVTTRTTEDLFGEQTVSESLYLERAQVLDAALKDARKDQAVFGRLVSEEERIVEGGQNRLDRSANMQRIQEARDAKAKISRLANSKGPISEALTEAAQSLKSGTRKQDAAAAFLEAARREILAGNRRGREARRARPGSDQAGARRLEPAVGEPLRIHDLPEAERIAAMQALISRQLPKGLDDIYTAAEVHQRELVEIAEELHTELGEDLVFADPGIKKRATAEEKLTRKGKKPGELTDIVRLGFMVRTPEIAARVIRRLGERLEVMDEGVSVTGMGYVDHKALVRFSDGLVGEVQLWDPAMARAKFGDGEKIYASVRSISAEDMAADPALAVRVAKAEEDSRELYAQALAVGSPEWRRVAMMMLPEDMRARVQALVEEGAGSSGAPGNISRKALRESSEPDSSTSTGEQRAQASESEGTKKPSTPPESVSRKTAGRHSQLKNRSAIDAPPRSIVRQVADEVKGTPDATRTGTVPDLEYETVLARAQDLIEKQGEGAQVVRQVDGENVERPLRTVIDELDGLEDTLERVRVCNQAERVVE